MLAPNASASGPPGAKRGSGSPPVPSVSRVVVAGDAQATTHTSSKSAHGRGRARLLASAQPPVPSLVSDSRVRGGFANPLASKKEASSVCRSNAGLPQRLPRRPLRRTPRRALPRGARRARGRVLHPRRV